MSSYMVAGVHANHPLLIFNIILEICNVFVHEKIGYQTQGVQNRWLSFLELC